MGYSDIPKARSSNGIPEMELPQVPLRRHHVKRGLPSGVSIAHGPPAAGHGSQRLVKRAVPTISSNLWPKNAKRCSGEKTTPVGSYT